MPSNWLDNLRTPKDLAPSVAAAITRQDQESERLVSYIQLVVILIFILLYSLAPNPAHEDAAFLPVPWVLGAYLTFTIVKILVSRVMSLPGWIVALSVFADMALLMATIWSFHVQYMQPPSFYLKAPTILYVFIFIGLRALRFDILYILLAGVTGAIGWTALVAYVIADDMHMELITRDYVEYMTGNAVMIGAEMDKIISILMVTGILALAVWRARRFLVRSISEATATQSLSQFFPKAVAERIAKQGGDLATGTAENREAAILTMDIRGFTKLSTTLSAEELVALLTEYQSHVVPVIQKHGGAVDKFLGDGILASFGAVSDHESYAAAAIEASSEILNVIDAWNAEREAAGQPPIGVGIGIAAGSIVFGVIGSADRLEYTVLGNPVNLASKLEGHNKALQSRTIATQAAYILAITQGLTLPTPPEEVLDCPVPGVQDRQDLVILSR